MKKCWCIAPEANGEFVAAMENILDIYHLPGNSKRPLVCLDEFCKQLVSEVSQPIKAKPGSIEKYDSEYVREGMATAFMIYAPHEGRREIFISDTGKRKKVDYAKALEFLSDVMFPNAEKIILVEDNLNTHSNGSLYEAFDPEKAHRIASRFERHHTPKHGSWLNIAESEISAVTRCSFPDRIPSKEEFSRLCKAAADIRNQKAVKTNWQFTTKDSRVKLSSLYPAYQS